MKKLYALFAFALATLSVCAQAWDGTTASWTQGEGTATSPYLIENGSHLSYLIEQVRAGNTYEGKYFKLNADLDMDNREVLPIGKFYTYHNTNGDMERIDGSSYFKGTFDGNYKTIDNLHVKFIDDSPAELGGTGLFACTTDGTVVRNLTLGENCVIEGAAVTGGFVGQMNGGLLENCGNRGLIQGGQYSGGIAGVIEKGKIIACYNSGKVQGTTEVGGILGQGAETGALIACYNTGNVEAKGYGGGGIVGGFYGTASVTNCYNLGNVTGLSNPYLGGPQAVVSDAAPTTTVARNYYVKAFTGVDDPKATAKTEAELKSDAGLALLNASLDRPLFARDLNDVNNGFPVLAWQNTGASGIAATTLTPFRIEGKELSADRPVTVYSLSGQTVGSGRQVRLESGVYVVAQGESTVKIVVR